MKHSMVTTEILTDGKLYCLGFVFKNVGRGQEAGDINGTELATGKCFEGLYNGT